MTATVETISLRVHAPQTTTHTITRSDLSTFDARGIYNTSTKAYEHGGKVASALDFGSAPALLPAGDAIRFRDASYNLHTISIGEATDYCLTIAIGDKKVLTFLAAAGGASANVAIPLQETTAVARVLLSKSSGNLTAVVECFALAPADAHKQRSSSGDIVGLFGEPQQTGGFKRVSSKEQIGG